MAIRRSRRKPTTESSTAPRHHIQAQVDEAFVEETNSTVPVKPEPKSKIPDHPDNPAAVDRRRQVVGTDEKRGQRRCG